MRAAYIEGFGGPEVIRYGELPDPEPGPHRHSVRPLEVSVGDVLPFSSAAHAHTLTERGELPRLPDHTVGRLVLRPDH
ncbi:MAG TPA: hypothetical protein VGJ19_07310 [Streptosporangiaceae bacterium]|jgi:NADPH:quinone reductase-like Zn-dependent oxidoreductase